MIPSYHSNQILNCGRLNVVTVPRFKVTFQLQFTSKPSKVQIPFHQRGGMNRVDILKHFTHYKTNTKSIGIYRVLRYCVL